PNDEQEGEESPPVKETHKQARNKVVRERESEREKQRGEHLEAHEIPVFNPLQHGCKRIGPNTRKQKHEDQSETKHGVDHGLWNHETTESQYTGSNERSGKQPVQTPLAPPHQNPKRAEGQPQQRPFHERKWPGQQTLDVSRNAQCAEPFKNSRILQNVEQRRWRDESSHPVRPSAFFDPCEENEHAPVQQDEQKVHVGICSNEPDVALAMVRRFL